MKLAFRIIEVFNQPEKGFKGNTSAVFLLEEALPDAAMQRIASDMLQPASTFLWPHEEDHHYHVRWFAPDSEIGLCGHGSLAAIAYIQGTEEIHLHYRNGVITGQRKADDTASINLEAITVTGEAKIPEPIAKGLGIPVTGYFTTGNKQIIVVNSEEELLKMKPDFSKLRESEVFGYAVTARGEKADFVSRTLVPHVHQLEDPATGSSHAALAPFWSKRLNKNELIAHQLSSRKGLFNCVYHENRVELSGHYSVLAEGNFFYQE